MKEWNDRNFIKKISFLSHSPFNLDVISFTLSPSSWISLLQESIHHHQIGWQSRGREREQKRRRRRKVTIQEWVSVRRRESLWVEFCLNQFQSFDLNFAYIFYYSHFLLLLDWNESLGVWKGKKHNMIKDGNGKMRVKNPQKLIIKSDHKWIPLMIFSQVLQLLWSSCVIHVFHNCFILPSFIPSFSQFLSFFSLIHVVFSPIWSSLLHPLIPNNLFQSIEVFNKRVMHHHHHPMHKDRRHYSLLSYSPFHVHTNFFNFHFSWNIFRFIWWFINQ